MCECVTVFFWNTKSKSILAHFCVVQFYKQVGKRFKNKSQTEVPVDPTDQVMLRLKLLEAFMDMSRFLLAFGRTGTEEDRNSSDDITKKSR